MWPFVPSLFELLDDPVIRLSVTRRSGSPDIRISKSRIPGCPDLLQSVENFILMSLRCDLFEDLRDFAFLVDDECAARDTHIFLAVHALFDPHAVIGAGFFLFIA